MISVTEDFADGTYTFKLGLKWAQELQEKCDAGPELIRARIVQGFPNAADIRETIRCGLIGGGMESAKALKLVVRYVDDEPRAQFYPLALAILNASIVGVPDDPVGKSAAGETTAAPLASETVNGPSAKSTD